VLFAGPHKSASSSVQEFFMRHASDNNKKVSSLSPASSSSSGVQHQHHPALKDWVWPYNPRVRKFLPRKGFAPLVVEYDNADLRNAIYQRMKRLWDQRNSNDGTSITYQNMIFGSEEFDRFGRCPWSNRTGLPAIHDVLHLLQPDDFSIIVNYRSPRYEQWISIWKQLVRNDHVDYKSYICSDTEYSKRWEYLDAVANPLGLVRHFRSQGWKVHLLDMEGISKAKLDISHVVACEVLGAQCNNGWMGDLDQILQNARTTDPGITQQEVQEMEWILRQRDCAYQEGIQNDDGVEILHEEALFRRCDGSPNKDYLNTTFLLGLLRAQMGCEGSGNTNSMAKLRSDMKKHETAEQSMYSDGNESFDQFVKVQLLSLLVILSFTVGMLSKRLKSSSSRAKQKVRGGKIIIRKV
jgi:hypothetical protein